MKYLRAIVLTVTAVLAAPVWAGQSPTDPVMLFGAAPQRAGMTLSPGGRLLAWLRPAGSGPEVVVYDLHARTIRRTLQMPDLSIPGLMWEDDGTLLIDTVQTHRLPADANLDWGRAIRLSRMLAVDIASGRGRWLLADRLNGGSGYFDTAADLLAWDIPQKPHTAIMAASVFDAGHYRQGTGTMIHNTRGDSGIVGALFSVDTSTGKDQPIAYGDGFTSQWVVDSNGNLLARADWQLHQFTLFAHQGSDWREIYRRIDPVEPRLAGVDQDSHSILAIVTGRDGRQYLAAIPLDGSGPKRMLPGVQQQVLGVEMSRYAEKLTSVWVGRSDPHRIWIDTAARSRYESIARAFPRREVRVYDESRDGGKTLAEVQGPSEPPIYYLIDFSTHHADDAGEAYPQLAHVALGTASSVRYQAGAGLSVRAQVILPPGGGKDLPLVVLAPGGPVGNDPEDFDWFAQYLASRGYAVLKPRIALHPLPTEGGVIYWGGVSQRYALDGVGFLVQQGIADPHRVCIVGVGYGGYAALSGAAFSPAAYACAVSVNGISDLPRLLGQQQNVFGGADSDHAALALWRTYMGPLHDPKLAEQSPLGAAGKVDAPVLLVHDENDAVVPMMQSQEMQRALEKAGKRVTFVKLDGGDHELVHAQTRIAVLNAVGGFLQKFLH